MSDPYCIDGPVKPVFRPVIGHDAAGFHPPTPVHHGFLHRIHRLPKYIKLWAVAACAVPAAGAVGAVTLVVRHWPIEHSPLSRHVYETQVEPLLAVPEPNSISVMAAGLVVLIAVRQLLGWKRRRA